MKLQLSDIAQPALDSLGSNGGKRLIPGMFAEDSPAFRREMGKLIKSMPVKRLFATGCGR